MMNKRRSSRSQSWRFLLALPMLLVLLSALRRHPAVQPGTGFRYTGYAVDARTLLPIEGVTITESTMGLTTTTDAHGAFRMEIPFDPAAPSQKASLVAHKEGRIDATGGIGMPQKLTSVHSVILMALPLRTDTAGRNTPFSIAIVSSRDPNDPGPTFDEMVSMEREEKTIEALTLSSADKIYFISGNNAYLLAKTGRVSIQDTTAPILVNGSLVLSGDEVNRRYKRDQVIEAGSLPEDSAFKKIGIKRFMLEIQTKP